MSHLSPAAEVVLVVLVVFIVAINLSLVFAFRHRFRDDPKNREQTSEARQPWESKDARQAEALHSKIEEMRKNKEGPGSL